MGLLDKFAASPEEIERRNSYRADRGFNPDHSPTKDVPPSREVIAHELQQVETGNAVIPPRGSQVVHEALRTTVQVEDASDGPVDVPVDTPENS